jgi:hypothetical protein
MYKIIFSVITSRFVAWPVDKHNLLVITAAVILRNLITSHVSWRDYHVIPSLEVLTLPEISAYHIEKGCPSECQIKWISFYEVSDLWCTSMYEDWKSYVRIPRTKTTVKHRLKVLEIPPAWRIIYKTQMFHSQTKKTGCDIRGWRCSECIEFHLCSIGWRPLIITDSALEFFDALNDRGRGTRCSNDWDQG